MITMDKYYFCNKMLDTISENFYFIDNYKEANRVQANWVPLGSSWKQSNLKTNTYLNEFYCLKNSNRKMYEASQISSWEEILGSDVYQRNPLHKIEWVAFHHVFCTLGKKRQKMFSWNFRLSLCKEKKSYEIFFIMIIVIIIHDNNNA